MGNAGDIRAGGAYVEVYADPKGVKTGLDKVSEQFSGSRREIKSILADLSGLQGGVARDLTAVFSEGLAGGLVGAGIAGVAAGVAIWLEYQKAMEKVAQTQREIENIQTEGAERMREFGQATEFANQALTAETGAKRFEEAIKGLSQSVQTLRNEYKKAAEEANKLLEGGKHDLADSIGLGDFMRGLDVLTGKVDETVAALNKVWEIRRQIFAQAGTLIASTPEQFQREQAASFDQLAKPGRLEDQAQAIHAASPEISLEDARKQVQEEEKYNEAVTKSKESAQEKLQTIEKLLETQKKAAAGAGNEAQKVAEAEAKAAAARAQVNQELGESVKKIEEEKKHRLDNLKAEQEKKRIEEGNKHAVEMGQAQEGARDAAADSARKVEIEKETNPTKKLNLETADKIAALEERARRARENAKSDTERGSIDEKLKTDIAGVQAHAANEAKKLADEAKKKADQEAFTTEELKRQLAIAQAQTPEAKRKLELADKIARIQHDLKEGKITQEQANLEEQIAQAKDAAENNKTKIETKGTFNVMGAFGLVSGGVEVQMLDALKKIATNTDRWLGQPYFA